MKNSMKGSRLGQLVLNIGIAGVGAAVLFGARAAFADEPYSMAPPVASADQGAVDASPDSVFNWTDVPENQKVPVSRAAFDQGGYQIYDSAGETIVVPFKNDNLYVMKFARSDDDSMYFVNRGDAPVLYVPDGGYLENATVSGARWYPFPHDYHPTGAVYVGPAPSWDVFIGMGWYPGMRYYGGYWCDRPVWDGGVFVAFPGLFFEIGGHSCYGWDNYRFYCNDHPGWFRPGFYNRNVYHWAGRPSLARPPFGSVSHSGFGGGHFGSGGHGEFHGGSSGFHGVSGGHSDGFRGTSGGYHTFHGADGGGSFGGSHEFRGSDSHTFGGSSDHTFRGGGNDNHNFGGGDHTFRGSSDSHGGSGGDHTFRGSSDSHGGGGGDHTFRGSSDSHSGGGGGNHNFGGGGHDGGDRGGSHGGGGHGGGDHGGHDH